MLEDFNTVQELTKKIEHLRAGEEPWKPGDSMVKSTPGQWWGRLLDMETEKRIRTLKQIIDNAEVGSTCTAYDHVDWQDRLSERIAELVQENGQWSMARSMIGLLISNLRRDQEGLIGQGIVADRLERALKTGDQYKDGRVRRILCGYRWEEMGRQFECADVVGPDMMHEGSHHAYLTEGSASGEELRLKYLEDENDALRKRLGLEPNRRLT